MGRRFGDLGTLLPFLVAYVSLVRMDVHGVLVALGLSCVAAGPALWHLIRRGWIRVT